MHAEPTPIQVASPANDARRHGSIDEAVADRDALAALHSAVDSDWSQRDAYEQHWVMELATSLWRQDRLRVLELAGLDAAVSESPPSDATVRKLGTSARYGARIDQDMAKALRTLCKRPDLWSDELQECTCEPGNGHLSEVKRASGFVARTPEPEPPILDRRRLADLARKRRAA